MDDIYDMYIFKKKKTNDINFWKKNHYLLVIINNQRDEYYS